MAIVNLEEQEKLNEERKRFLDKVLPPVDELVNTRGKLRAYCTEFGRDHEVLNLEGFSFRLMRDFRDRLGEREEFVRLGIQVWHHPWSAEYTKLPPKEYLRLDVRTETMGFSSKNCSVRFFEETGKDQWQKTLEYVVDHMKEIVEKIDNNKKKMIDEMLAIDARSKKIEDDARRLGFNV